jgi:hypothetical protein
MNIYINKTHAAIKQYADVIQCKSITPIAGIINNDNPPKKRPDPSTVEIITAFAPFLYLISGFSLRIIGIDVLIRA